MTVKPTRPEEESLRQEWLRAVETHGRAAVAVDLAERAISQARAHEAITRSSVGIAYEEWRCATIKNADEQD